jgi:hypothetical protein
MSMTGFADSLRRKEAVKTGAAAEIDHSLSWLQRGNRLRVAATKPEIRAVGNGSQPRLGVAHPARFIV